MTVAACLVRVALVRLLPGWSLRTLGCCWLGVMSNLAANVVGTCFNAVAVKVLVRMHAAERMKEVRLPPPLPPPPLNRLNSTLSFSSTRTIASEQNKMIAQL